MFVQRSSAIHQLVRPASVGSTHISDMYDVVGIEAALARSFERESGLRLLTLSTSDGRAVAQVSHLDTDGRRIAAMANSFLTLGETLSRELQLSDADYATICTRAGNVVLIRIAGSKPLTLTAVGRPELNLAVLLFHARDTAQRLADLLQTQPA
ncbi:roadblock/LC7 domain-containing protein [Stenotrophomonas sp. C3(2023)]|uniref:roadblock/LC7 domain-containing protein n=1 Tax=Stenotrophomonas sp. C3(2023) TaxID=3080277 RepID=UPI00293C3D92|nr:roadblock/LC7 domain-containing protein [Stenotrophomonas sp. C3(2023)]MDV3467437.1 roadblock/LC7 domain-containing protein [Stenotrophomonas sp. C3(2023)]